MPFEKYYACAQTIAQAIAAQAVLVDRSVHASGEIELGSFDIAVQRKDVCIVQSITNHDELLAVLLLVYKLKKEGASNVCLLSPYLMYSRLDKTQEFKAIIHMLESSGIDHIITVELHNPAVLAWFSIPVTHIQLDDVICDYVSGIAQDKQIYLVSPDLGGVQRVKRLAQRLSLPSIICVKKRSKNGIEIMVSKRNISDAHAIFIDDIIDTGETTIALSTGLRAVGVESISGIGVHPVFSIDKQTIIKRAKLAALVTSNTIQKSDICNVHLDITPYVIPALEHIL